MARYKINTQILILTLGKCMEKTFQLTMLRKSKQYLGINLKGKIKRNVKYLSEETITEYKVMI